ncbi:uracil-DNA glycosylase [Tolumonas osonensis]|uniref:Uracil-DNA glycosylase n=1 Tax=Tolumonas osonensis TaxID=675874 RepID=A0A841GE41_9GAMM|nr:uracil-DNA glycosylase [Tolumonas osonensis]
MHETGIPFNDASGDRLRAWLGVSRDVFYDASQIAILPMGFCFPGTGKSGDLHRDRNALWPGGHHCCRI